MAAADRGFHRRVPEGHHRPRLLHISFTASSLVMMAGLAYMGLLDGPLLAGSALAVIPVAAGIAIGGRIRARLAEATFRRLVLVLLVLLGLNLMRPV